MRCVNSPFFLLTFMCLFLLPSVAASEAVEWNNEQHHPYFADINGDGVDDLLLHSTSEELPSSYTLAEVVDKQVQYLTARQTFFPTHIKHALWHDKNAQLLFADFTADGLADLLVILPLQKRGYLFSTTDNGLSLDIPTRTYKPKHFKWLKTGNGVYRYFTGDFNGDERTDFLVTSEHNGKHYLMHGKKKGKFTQAQQFKENIKWGLKKAERLLIADFNQDGRDDVFALARNKNKPNYVVFANKKGKLKKRNQHKWQSLNAADDDDTPWQPNEASTILYNAPETDTLDLIRLTNALGGYDEQGNYYEGDAPEPLPGGRDYTEGVTPSITHTRVVAMQPSHAPTDEPPACEQRYFSPNTAQSGKTCAPYDKSNEVNSSGLAPSIYAFLKGVDDASKSSYPDPCFNINSVVGVDAVSQRYGCDTRYPPTRPINAPEISSNAGSTYQPVNYQYNVKMDYTPGSVWFELYESRTNSNYQKVYSGVASYTNRKFNRYSYVYYKYRTCNPIGCSAFSPYSRIYVYTAPGRPPLSISATSVKTGEGYSLTMKRAGGAVTGAIYKLQEAYNNGSFKQICTRTQTSAATETYTCPISGKSAAGTYKYVAYTCNPNGVGCGGSNQVAITVSAPPPPKPAVPSISLPSTGTVGVPFAVSFNTVAGATSYKLYRNGSYLSTVSRSPISQTINSAGTYRYQLSACNSTGCSGLSATREIPIKPPKPAVPTISLPSTGTVGVPFAVSFNTVAGATSYKLYRNGSYFTSVSRSPISQTISSAGTYRYQLSACNSAGCSGLSAAREIPIKPATPTISLPSTGTVGVPFAVSFNTVAGATSYKLYRNGSYLSTVSRSPISQTINSAGTYRYQLSACNSAGCSGLSAARSIEIKAPLGITLTKPIQGEVFAVNELHAAARVSDGSAVKMVKFSADNGATWFNDSDAKAPWQFTFPELSVGQHKVMARLVEHNNSHKTSAAVTVTLVLAAPTVEITYTVNSASYQVSWSQVAGAARYQLEEKIADGSWQLIDTISSTTKGFIDQAPNNYSYRVKACDSSGQCGAFSPVQNVLIDVASSQCSVE